MDFLSLENGSFQPNSLKKLWVYFTVAIPVTIITFIIWYLWDKRKAKSDEPPSPEQPEVLVVAQQEENLEPLPKVQPTADEMVEDLLSILGQMHDESEL